MVHPDAVEFDGRAFNNEMHSFKRGDRCRCTFFLSLQSIAGEFYLNYQGRMKVRSVVGEVNLKFLEATNHTGTSGKQRLMRSIAPISPSTAGSE